MAETKREGGKDFHRSDYAYTPDGPSTWKLRLTNTPGGAPDARIVGAAVAALGKGFRGQKVQIPAADLAAVKRKVRGAWRRANPGKGSADMPAVLKEEVIMNEEIMKALEGDFDGEKLQATLKEAKVSEKGVEAATAIARILAAFKADLPEDLPILLGYPEPEPKVVEKIVEVEKKEKTDEEKIAEVLKSVGDPEARDQIAKMAEANKKLAEKQAELEKTLKAEQEAKEIKEFVEKATKEFANLPARADEIGPALRVVNKAADKEQYELIERLLKAADEAIAKAKEPIGGPGSAGDGDTYAELTTKAAQMVSDGKATSVEQAIAKMVSDNPKLYDQYAQES